MGLTAAASLLVLGLGVTSASALEPDVVVQGRTNSSTTLDVSWTDVKGADAYRIQYSTDDDLKKSVERLPDVEKGTEATISGLEPDETYYVQVVALDDKGATVADSKVVKATTSYPFPAPGDVYATKVTSSSATLSWKSVGSTPGYTVTTSVGGKTTTTDTDKASIDLSGLKRDTQYQVKVRAGKGKDALSEDSPTQSFSTSDYAIAAPDELTQTKQSSTTVGLSWDAVSGLDDDQGYVVEYALDTAFTSKDSTTDTISKAGTTLKGLDDNQTYYARVWVVDAKGKRVSNRSDYITIKTLVPRGTLKGAVSGPSGDLEAVAYDKSGQAAQTVSVSGGRYELDVRPDQGPYKVQILYVGPAMSDKKDDDHNWTSLFAHTSGSGWTIGQGATYKVTEGETTKVDDVTLKHGNVVEGTVTNGVKDKDGKYVQISNVDVTAISGAGAGKPNQEREVIGMDRTGANEPDAKKKGYFLLGGLPDGEYWFRFNYVGSGQQYAITSQHLEVEDTDLSLAVTLKKK